MDSKHSKYLEQLRKAHESLIIDDESYQDMIKAISCFNKNNDTENPAYAGVENEATKVVGGQCNVIYNHNLKEIPNDTFGIEINGDMLISGNLHIVGDISAAQFVKINGNTKIEGNVHLYKNRNENREINEAIGINIDDSVKIRSGQAELIASGTVIAFKGNPVEIEITSAGESLKLIFFFSEENQENIPVKANILNAQTVELTLFRAKNPLDPTGTIKPFSLGTWRDKQLYLHYRVYDIQDGDSAICFNIYLQDEALER
ncbi:hypothetical protein VU06_00685 [Desulfobulbus sp. F3]|nr:hypothetical protein [Desulfobulbus sp. F3]